VRRGKFNGRQSDAAKKARRAFADTAKSDLRSKRAVHSLFDHPVQ
jgi:hypothetical protein